MFDQSINEIAKESDLNKEEFEKNLKEKFEDVIEGFEEVIVDYYLKNNKFSLKDFLSTHSQNQKTIVSENQNIFKYFIIYINSCHVIYERSYENIEQKNIPDYLKLSIPLYGIIVRKSEQIVTLLIDGYIDAAMIIWRSLYENTIACLTILKEENDELAEKFRRHSFKNSKKKFISYNENYQELNFKPSPNGMEEEIKEEQKSVEEKYGKEFIRNEFGWADDLFDGKQKASLRFLERRLNLNRYRPYYLLCSEHTHLGFNSFNNYKEENGIILPRITKQEHEGKSFIDPMQFTIAILHEMNNAFIYKISVDQECDINLKLLKRISEKFTETFSKSK